VTFHQVSGSELPVADASADAVFSVHVMQHLDNQRAIERYLNEAHRALKPGGTIMIHIMIAPDQTTWRKRAKLRLDLLRSRRALARGEEHFAVQMVMPRPWAAVQMMERSGFTNVELRAFRVNSNNSFYTFFMGRR
jgi:ubiquinone/menaquinone biosynthesis C-methylase UbiE